jgi:hypothetical protein
VSGKDTINQKIKDKSLYQKKECRIFNCKRWIKYILGIIIKKDLRGKYVRFN